MIIKLKGYVCVVIIACIQISDSIQRNFWHLLVFKSPWPIEAASLIQALLLLYGIYNSSSKGPCELHSNLRTGDRDIFVFDKLFQVFPCVADQWRNFTDNDDSWK